MKQVIMLILFSQISFLYACSPASTGTNDSIFSFVFMTDIHLQPEKGAIKAFSKAITEANKLHPDFVITGGDNIMDALGQDWERSDSLCNIFQSMIKQLPCRIYTAMGNHDVFGLYENSKVMPEHPEFGKKMYEQRFCKRYYSFDHKNWHFIVLDGIGIADDPTYYGYVDQEQMEWIKTDLQKNGTSTPIIICTHIPLMSVESQVALGPTKAFDKKSIINNANEVRALFDGYPVKLVLQGHTHFLKIYL
jgi:3',5'-cyclic AMP phosphodiesterase CpdA